MNSVHDVGGMHGFGAIEYEESEPVFHHEWEARLVGMRFGTGPRRVISSLDASRYAVERMDPALYLAARYYERWLITFEQALVEKGFLSQDEIDARTAHYLENPDAAVPHREDPELTARALKLRATPNHPPADAVPAPRFKVGDAVRTRNFHPKGHTRLPRYARGKHGVIVQLLGVQELPDAKAHDLEPQPQMVYAVRFDGRELWGEDAEPGTCVYIDLWDSYLEPA